MEAVTDSENLRKLIEARYAEVQVPGLTRRLLQVSYGDGRIELQFEVAPVFANRAGFVQGGICATMLESGMSMVGAVKSGGLSSLPMVEFRVSLMKPVSVGLLIVQAEVIRMGRTLAFVEASLMDSEGKLLARASGTGIPKPVVAAAEGV